MAYLAAVVVRAVVDAVVYHHAAAYVVTKAYVKRASLPPSYPELAEPGCARIV